MRILLPVVLAGLAAAQASPLPSPLAADLEALSRRVDAAHRPQSPPPVTAFRGEIALQLVDASAEQGGRAELTVQYLQWQPPDGDRLRHLIRYRVRDTQKPLERGRDHDGPWQRMQGVPRDLLPDSEDRKALVRDTNLARQLVRFLDPGAVLRSLTGASPVRDETLRIGRETEAVPCQTVAGGLVAFPLLQKGGDDAAVEVKVWVTKAEGRLLAIDAWPLVDGKRDEAAAERVRLLELREIDGLLVPRTLEHQFRDAEGRWRTRSRAALTTLSLRPALTVADFDRTK